ncbi:DNA cytosine methyltransferase, partial [Spirosoma utsteinense]
MNAQQKPEIWSFFSGAMGLDIGLEKAGLKTTLAVEVHPIFCETIKNNMPELDVVKGDVRNLTGELLRQKRDFYDEVYLMVGGPPCQSFSTGGKRSALSDPRGNLIYEYLRLINEIQPKFFVLENVASILTAAVKHRKIADRPGKSWNLKAYSGRELINGEDGILPLLPEEQSGSAFRFLLDDIKALGYHVTFGVLNSADYGASQKRLRFVMIGSKLGSPPNLPKPTHGERQNLMSYNTVRHAIGDITESPGPHSV